LDTNKTQELNISSDSLYDGYNIRNSSNVTKMAINTGTENGLLVSKLNVKQVAETKEFPGMPDPCAKPRRKTGVEDILCMVSDVKSFCMYL
jgi:hypothetical protein